MDGDFFIFLIVLSVRDFQLKLFWEKSDFEEFGREASSSPE